jgi:hypothetical protein
MNMTISLLWLYEHLITINNLIHTHVTLENILEPTNKKINPQKQQFITRNF